MNRGIFYVAIAVAIITGFANSGDWISSAAAGTPPAPFSLPNLVRTCLPTEGRMVRDGANSCHCPPQSYCPKGLIEWGDSPRMPPEQALLCCDPPSECSVWDSQTVGACPAGESTSSSTPIKLCSGWGGNHIPVPPCTQKCTDTPDPCSSGNCGSSSAGGGVGAPGSGTTQTCVDDCKAHDDALAENEKRDEDAKVATECAAKCGIGKPGMSPAEWGVLNNCYTACTPKTALTSSCNKQAIFNYCTLISYVSNCPSTPSGDCVGQGVQVTLKDGSRKAIESLKAGDVVKGESAFNNVLEVVKPERKSPIVSINQGELILTSDHPIATDAGYKAVDFDSNKSAVKLYGLDKVGKLKVGDTVVTQDGKLEVKSIEVLPENKANPSVTYNLRLDGNKTFYANGVLVRGF